MTNMNDYILWLKSKQENDPEWKAAKAYQDRFQTPQKSIAVEKKTELEEIPETPKPEE